MIILRNLEELKVWKNSLKPTIRLGFVPTMGALHEGHMTLLEQAIKENDFSVVSIFVNPTQFNNKEDLENYPREHQKDIELLEDKGCDVLFLPTEEIMYPEGQTSQKFNFEGLENQMEGAFRPGHFDGVGTIVKKFMDLIEPAHAYFGEKDFQQLRIIQTLVKAKNLKVKIVPVPIARSNEGLALSSRNSRLSKDGKLKALFLYKSLESIKQLKNEYSVQEVIKMIEDDFKSSDLELEYISIVDEQTLLPIKNWEDSKNVRAFIAAYVEGVRLIDNLKLG